MSPSRKLRFIQLLPNSTTKGNFILKDLPGSGKRIDLLCRVLSACFDWAPVTWKRSHLEVIAVIQNMMSLIFKDPGDQMPLGEVAWAKLIQDVLEGKRVPFITRWNQGLEYVIDTVQAQEGKIWFLHEEGKPLKEIDTLNVSAQNSFMLGDHIGFDSKASRLIEKAGIQPVSLGKTSYLSSHCTAAVISEFERRIN
ncbi:MAG: hypothetical protein BAJATHORv1_10358 [Candidatus Thorarchaeota archaeon]|nr:MAG: hypothetical protein BAJATHORv1_10358 [Candidatus Thorarchaeota archaeon]